MRIEILLFILNARLQLNFSYTPLPLNLHLFRFVLRGFKESAYQYITPEALSCDTCLCHISGPNFIVLTLIFTYCRQKSTTANIPHCMDNKSFLLISMFDCRNILLTINLLKYRVFKNIFTTLKSYINVSRGHIQCFLTLLLAIRITHIL
jgi:hypothetical protein